MSRSIKNLTWLRRRFCSRFTYKNIIMQTQNPRGAASFPTGHNLNYFGREPLGYPC